MTGDDAIRSYCLHVAHMNSRTNVPVYLQTLGKAWSAEAIARRLVGDACLALQCDPRHLTVIGGWTETKGRRSGPDPIISSNKRAPVIIGRRSPFTLWDFFNMEDGIEDPDHHRSF